MSKKNSSKQKPTLTTCQTDIAKLLAEPPIDKTDLAQMKWALALSALLRSTSELLDIKHLHAKPKKARTSGVLVELFKKGVLASDLSDDELYILEAVEDGDYGSSLEADVEELVKSMTTIMNSLSSLLKDE